MKGSVSLLNEKFDKDKGIILEQYKIISESADKVTDKRQNTNNFYLAVNTFFIGTASYLAMLNLKMMPIIISIAGFLLSIIWYKNINSFKKLNSAKFKVIHEIEEYLPLRVYKKENEYLKGYNKLTSCEKYVPWIFGIVYLIIILVIIISYL